MAVLPFRKPSTTSAKSAPEPPSISAQVNQLPGDLSSLDLTQLLRIEGEVGADGSAQITYTAALELKMRQLTGRFGMPRLPFTVDELRAFLDYVAYLEGCRADRLENNEIWQRHSLSLAEEHFPGYAPGLRLFLAENQAGLAEHHRTNCGYAQLIEYANKYY